MKITLTKVGVGILTKVDDANGAELLEGVAALCASVAEMMMKRGVPADRAMDTIGKAAGRGVEAAIQVRGNA